METLFEALNTLPVSAVILDASGTIVAVNDTWKEFGRRNGLRIPSWGVGANYLKYSGGKGLRSTRFVRDLRDLLAGRLDLLTAIYPCHSPSQKRWFSLVGVPFPLDRPTGAALLHVNLTNMLKLPTEGHRQQVKTAASEQGRSEQGHSKGPVRSGQRCDRASCLRDALGASRGYAGGQRFFSPAVRKRPALGAAKHYRECRTQRDHRSRPTEQTPDGRPAPTWRREDEPRNRRGTLPLATYH
jgi:hypothetical protein